jgi:hypothetical protein
VKSSACGGARFHEMIRLGPQREIGGRRPRPIAR